MSEEKLYRLLEAYFNNSISSDDCKELLSYLNETDDDITSLAIDDVLSRFQYGEVYTTEQSKTVYSKILSDSRFKRRDSRPILKLDYGWLKYAAIFLIFLATAVYFAISYNSTISIRNSEKMVVSALPIPDSTKVMLSTSNGASVALDTVRNGLITVEGNTEVNKTNDGLLAYQNSEHWLVKEAVFHTLFVPRGTTYRIQLADGTKVWLNSVSSLSYPSEFLGKQRKVILSGEAYFEVAPNKDKPFLVEANGNTIEVLGTHFNISAYSDEDLVKTTLLEGSVKVINKNKSAIIVPGQQAIGKINQPVINIKQPNLEEVMAWKNGYFVFEDADIKSIMKELIRWYNVDIQYEGEITNQKFGGTFSKTKSITELLKYLETLGDVRFKIEGRRVIVMP